MESINIILKKLKQNIKRKYIQHKIEQYTIKKKVNLEKANASMELATSYFELANILKTKDLKHYGGILSKTEKRIKKLLRLWKKNKIASAHFRSVSEMYQSRLEKFEKKQKFSNSNLRIVH